MTKLIASFILFVSALTAQGAHPSASAIDRLYEPKYLSWSKLVSVCDLAQRMTVGVSVRPVGELNVVQLTGSPDNIAKAEEILKKFDVPQAAAASQPQVEFAVYLVRAGSSKVDAPGRPIPPELESAVAEMKRSFSYESYTLLDTIVSPVNYSLQMENVLPDLRTPFQSPYFYTVAMEHVGVSADHKTVTVAPFSFKVRLPYQAGPEVHEGNTGITTNFTVREGQKLVIGKVTLSPTEHTDVFLIVTVKLR